MYHTISTTAPVLDVIQQRWSPKAFTAQPVGKAQLQPLFEAARMAASGFNEQPWQFIVGCKYEDETQYQRVLQCFNDDNRAWAQTAPVVMIVLAKLYFDKNGMPNPWAWHDVGLAVAQLNLQAVNEGMQLSQAAGILHDKVRETFGVGELYQPCTGIALGYPGTGDGLNDSLRAKHRHVRTRKPVSSFVHYGMPQLPGLTDEQQLQTYHLLKNKIAFGNLQPMIDFFRGKKETI
ncbi:nitroreductase family protein [Deminuibacter soli]|uniref:Nitroreductase n=1 Tax=Deminuibacter soli TaxID=2291815 RepID=A0A3E1NHK8_9BACT|nr:nitroreductase family protein [Deminuibacter soli]RFM27415.1 nitroreductase [Deminuibacter soli]